MKQQKNKTHQPIQKLRVFQRTLPVFSSKVFVVFGRLIMTINSLNTNGIYGRVPSPVSKSN